MLLNFSENYNVLQLPQRNITIHIMNQDFNSKNSHLLSILSSNYVTCFHYNKRIFEVFLNFSKYTYVFFTLHILFGKIIR